MCMCVCVCVCVIQIIMKGAALKQLKLANNELVMLPKQMSALSRLNTLVVDSNTIQAWPEVSARVCVCMCEPLLRA